MQIKKNSKESIDIQKIKNILRKNKLGRRVYALIGMISHQVKSSFYRRYFRKKQQICIEAIRKKSKIKISFLVSSISQWKLQSVYNAFLENKRYELSIYVVAESSNNPDAIQELNNTLKVFRDNKINAIDAFSDPVRAQQEFERLQKSDIVFFSRRSAWNGPLSLKRFTKSITCYVPYSIHLDLNNHLQYGTLFHQCLWKHYLPLQEFKRSAKLIYNADNCEVIPYPGLDPFVDILNILTDRWAANWKDCQALRIIWAPHHTIDEIADGPYFSTFLTYAESMYNLALHNKALQICFKPHPALKSKLYNHVEWGRERTDKYYSRWEDLTNGFLHESIYHDLFLTADAMILDSVSFISEFSSLKKPICFLTRLDKGDYSRYFNEFGNKVFSVISKAGSWAELMEFINRAESVINETSVNLKGINLSAEVAGKIISKRIGKALGDE